MNVDRCKSIEQLEQDFWYEPGHDSFILKTCHNLRKKPLENFTAEDLRLMIGQNIGLHFLIPIALELLNKNILTEGDYFPGDLLESLLRADEKYWEESKPVWDILKGLIKQNNSILEADNSFKQILKRVEKFQAIHKS